MSDEPVTLDSGKYNEPLLISVFRFDTLNSAVLVLPTTE